ncbi:hypothetical protein PsWM33_02284 [Pseudovibrio sp. WM33]|nr:hypothetical protein PsWM33_02284 [Pseudovibrio sp. WM33]
MGGGLEGDKFFPSRHKVPTNLERILMHPATVRHLAVGMEQNDISILIR